VEPIIEKRGISIMGDAGDRERIAAGLAVAREEA
jgi:hypothetical protein